MFRESNGLLLNRSLTNSSLPERVIVLEDWDQIRITFSNESRACERLNQLSC
jgi:hypothetical protein